MSATPPPGPALVAPPWEHSFEVLQEFAGLDADRLALLRADGVIGQHED